MTCQAPAPSLSDFMALQAGWGDREVRIARAALAAEHQPGGVGGALDEGASQGAQW